MTKEKAKHISEVLKAYSEGKVIEYRVIGIPSNWTIYLGDFPFDIENFQYRIKTEPKFRPYANAEEFLKAQKEHGPMFTCKDDGESEFYAIFSIDWDVIHYGHRDEAICCTIEELMEYYKWQDGTPCGVIQEM